MKRTTDRVGYTAHDAVIVTISSYQVDEAEAIVETFREQMPPYFRHLLVGPIHSPCEGYATYFLAPDGSKEGWPQSSEGDEWREKFVELFSFAYEDGSSPYELLEIRYGPDHVDDYGVTVKVLHRDEDVPPRAEPGEVGC